MIQNFSCYPDNPRLNSFPHTRKRSRSLPHRHGNRLAHLPPAGEVPFVREAAALLRLHRVDAAGIAVQHDALMVVLLDERKALAVRPQAGETIEELLFR